MFPISSKRWDHPVFHFLFSLWKVGVHFLYSYYKQNLCTDRRVFFKFRFIRFCNCREKWRQITGNVIGGLWCWRHCHCNKTATVISLIASNFEVMRNEIEVISDGVICILNLIKTDQRSSSWNGCSTQHIDVRKLEWSGVLEDKLEVKTLKSESNSDNPLQVSPTHQFAL
jgi:hypothetical protein